MSENDRVGNFLLAAVLLGCGILIGIELQTWIKVDPMAAKINNLQKELIQRGIMRHNPVTGELEFVEQKDK